MTVVNKVIYLSMSLRNNIQYNLFTKPILHIYLGSQEQFNWWDAKDYPETMLMADAVVSCYDFVVGYKYKTCPCRKRFILFGPLGLDQD